MKVGTENRTKLILAVALMVVAVTSLWWAFSRPAPPEPTTASAAIATTATTQSLATAAKTNRPATHRGATPVTDSIDPTLRIDLLKASEDIEYLGTGRNIFRAQAEAPPPVIEKPMAPVYTPPPPPTTPLPPPILLKFFGFASRSGESKKVFLSQNDDIFVAAEGDIVKGRYKILRILPNAIEVEDVLNNNRQSIPLTQS